jgi:hypothetical protein
MTKKILLIFSAILFALVSCSKTPIDKPDEIDPGDLGGGNFDNWVVLTQGTVSYDNPAFNWWTTLNPLSTIGGPKTVTKTNDSKAGPYAARLETKVWGTGFIIPGLLASGVFDQTLPPGDNVVIGRPFSKKPKSFTGHYKYFPQGDDSFGFVVALTKFDSQAGIRDTIATASFSSGLAKPTYTLFNVDFDYKSQSVPDSIHLVIVSSSSDMGMQGVPGTVLYVDELELKYNK